MYYKFVKFLDLIDVVMKVFIISVLLIFLAFGELKACDPADFPDVICISELKVAGGGDDYITICNNSADPYELEAVMIVDSNPDNEITLDLVIPAFSCITLLAEDIDDGGDLDFGFGGGGDSFTITCMDGVQLLSVTYEEDDVVDDNNDPLDGFVLDDNIPGFDFCDPPISACDSAVTSICVRSIDPRGGSDDVELCNDSGDVVSLSGAFGSDDPTDEDDEIGMIAIPPYGCVIITGSFGLSDNNPEEFFLTCDGTVLASATYELPPDGSTDEEEDAFFPFVNPNCDIPVAPVTVIPTMGEWGLIALTLLFLIFGTLKLKEEFNTSLA
jgi:hypothetical protein